MKNNSKYFCNRECEYFPCHKNISKEEFNCLFCYCPMNQLESCLGTPNYIISKSGKKIKDCSKCVYPHVPENYDKILSFLQEKLYR